MGRLDGVMPKDRITNITDEYGYGEITTRWYNFHEGDSEREYIPELVAVSISVGEPFVFVGDDDEVYQDLFFNFSSSEQIDQFIASLRRAQRKVFKIPT